MRDNFWKYKKIRQHNNNNNNLGKVEAFSIISHTEC